MTKNSLRNVTTIAFAVLLNGCCGAYLTSPPYGHYPAQAQAPAPAPVAAAPQPAMPQTFTVYFALNRATLNRDGQSTVANAAAAAQQNQGVALTVNGYTDTSGGKVYNRILAQRRADAVKAQLIANGVAPQRITTRSYGETNLAVPTRDGVRNAQNRRVEIIIAP